MRELAAGEVDDGHQMPVRTKSASPSDGRLDLGVDRFGRAVGQAQPDAVDDAVQMISHGRAQSLEGREPATPRPGHPAFEPRFGVMAVLGGFEEAAQRFLEPPGTGGLQIQVRQPVHVVDLGSVPATMILMNASIRQPEDYRPIPLDSAWTLLPYSRRIETIENLNHTGYLGGWLL